MSSSRSEILKEVEAIEQLLREAHTKLEQTARSTVAARHLLVVINRLDSWRSLYAPPTDKVLPEESPEIQLPWPLPEVERAHKLYKTRGYFNLAQKDREIIKWLADNRSRFQSL